MALDDTQRGIRRNIPAAVLLFVIGRITFAVGYAGGAVARAFGFALTFYPTALLTAVALGAMLWRGVGD